jgi:predicted dehydrogenase
MQAFAGPFQDVNGFADLDRTDEPGSEHNIIATLRTHSGTIASLHVSRTQWRPTFRLELGYERGYLWMEGLATEAHAFGQEALIYARTDGGETRHETVDRFEESNGALVALSGFVERILHPNAPILGTSQDAFDTLNTAQRVLAADPILSLSQERHAS